MRAVLQLVEQRLVLRTGAAAQRADAVGHRIERTALALRTVEGQAARLRIVRRGAGVQGDGLVRLG